LGGESSITLGRVGHGNGGIEFTGSACAFPPSNTMPPVG
jgi:hypothetical protein